MSATPARIALLRAVNVGGRAMAMADLRIMASDLGLHDVRTLLQSGNLVFRGGGDAAALEVRLEDAAEERFGFRADVLVRELDEWEAMIAANPFPVEARNDPARLVVFGLKSSADASGLAALRAAIMGPEYAEAAGRAAYIVYPDGQGASKLTINVIERALGARGTARNWNTVLKLAALARG